MEPTANQVKYFIDYLLIEMVLGTIVYVILVIIAIIIIILLLKRTLVFSFPRYLRMYSAVWPSATH